MALMKLIRGGGCWEVEAEQFSPNLLPELMTRCHQGLYQVDNQDRTDHSEPALSKGLWRVAAAISGSID